MAVKTFFGERLAAMRASRNLTRAALARQTELHPVHIAKLESGGTADPKWSTVCALATFFGVSTDHFRVAGKTSRGKA